MRTRLPTGVSIGVGDFFVFIQVADVQNSARFFSEAKLTDFDRKFR